MMHYDPHLGEKIGGNYSGPHVLNKAFADWEGNVARNVKNRASRSKDRYDLDDYTLLQACREHAVEFTHINGHSQTIALVHPFYLHLGHMHGLKNDRMRENAGEYLSMLLHLLLLRRKNTPEVGVVALDTAHHYASATSLLLEQGLVDGIVFTGYDNGIPNNPSDLEVFSDQPIYFAGGYNGLCLKDAVESVKSFTSRKKMWAIRELVLASPLWQSKTLRVKRVKRISKRRVLSLDEAVEKLGLG